MLTQFRIRYPQGSLISELVKIDRSLYIVRALVEVDGVTLATGLAGAHTVEEAEDRARSRALATLTFDATNSPIATKTARERREVTAVSASSPAQIKTTEILKQPEPNIDLLPANNTLKEDLPSVSRVKSDRTISSLPASFEPTPQSKEVFFPTSSIDSEQNETTIIVQEPLSSEDKEELTVLEEPGENEVNISNQDTVEFSQVITETNGEIRRLGWTQDQGRNYLVKTYGKRSRHALTNQELWEFLQYLKQQPTPQ